MWKWKYLVVAVLLGSLATLSKPSLAKPPLGKNWPAAQRVSMESIRHAALDKLLDKYVDDDGYVDYKAWQASRADRQALQNYLVALGRASREIGASKAARLAFWINAYNAVTIEGILQVYPTESIRNHTAKLFGYNIWKNLPLWVGGRQYSLNAIEHEILRKMNEPRIHFAIVCASVGCPTLRDEAYTAEKLEQQLAENARDFFRRSKNLRIDRQNRTLYLSSILSWFGEDFGKTQSQRLRTIRPYLPEAAQDLIDSGNVRVRYLEYDWGLNDQARK